MDNLRGSLLMIAAMAGFAVEDLFIKRVSAELPVSQILLLIGGGGAVIFILWAMAQRAPLFAPELFAPAMMARNFGEVVGTICFVTAVTLIPLSTAAAILQATPLVVTLGAALFLGAAVGWRRWAAILAGLAGVLMILRPGLAGFDVNALFAVGAVICLALRDICTRVAPRSVSSVVLSAWGFGMVALAGVALLPFGAPPVWPSLSASTQIACGVLFGALGYYAITAAMRVGDIAVVTPFRYTRLVFALLIGVVLFGERPDAWTLAGAAIIIASGLYAIWREQRQRSAGTRPLATSAPSR